MRAVPTTALEMASALRESAASGRSLRLEGASTKRRMAGRADASADEVVTTGLSRVIEYEPRDLTISVEAGVKYAELSRLVAGHRQMLPLDPPCAAEATVGGVIATNSSGPRRRLYGTARDMVIGMKFATVDGELLESGGMVVKNVAGLDVQKILIGSFGTLGAIASVNFRLYPMPEATRTYVQIFTSAAECAAARDEVLRGALQPAALDALNPAAAAQAGLEGFCLLVRAGGSEGVLARYGRELRGAAEFEGAREAEMWAAIENWPARQRYVVRAGHALKALGDVLESAPAAVVSRAGTGVSYLSFGDAQQLAAWMARTQGAGWTRIVEWSPDGDETIPELWPDAGADLSLMTGMKKLFDPKGVLNRGRLYGRI
ncbi:MAG: FAD-binding oxidoreductase [Acidobacteria bacterium]|nr:FAD-binding oxidoreductase [Acidobacteriota bacterium]